MPEELTPLPCPACGAHPELGGSQDGSELWVACGNIRKCRMAGPTRKNVTEAVAAWNALPRALEWTDEPPKGPGWYWYRHKPSRTIAMINVDVEPIEYESLPGQWAGPIPEPRETK